MNSPKSFGQLLRLFLIDPQLSFTPFYRACHIKATAFLALQRSRGRVLAGASSPDDHDLQNLACDILKYLFLHEKGEHFQKIFAFFRDSGVSDIEAADPVHLEELFYPFFYQQLKQGLSREGKWEHPERSARKKTIENILREEEYAAVPDHPDCIASQKSLGSLRADAKPAPRELIEQVAWESVLCTHTTTDLCREFFRRLNCEVEFQNFVGRRELVFVLTRAIERLALEISPIGGQFPTPEQDRQARAARTAADRALVRVKMDDIAPLLEKKTITRVEADGFTESCRFYLDDRCNGNGTDKLAAYFRAGFPDDYHPQYEKVYKHKFLKIIGMAEQYYTEELDVLL